MKAKPNVPAPTPPAPKSRRLDLRIPQGVTQDRAEADLAAAGLVSSAGLVVGFSRQQLGELSLTDLVHSLKASGEAVNRNDLSGPEQMLNSQAIALNAMFAELARRSLTNMGEYLDASERYMRLALKAQSQCRATLETLAAIKNPPVVYAKQANFANGPQQVNNGTACAHASTAATQDSEGRGNEQTKLLEAQHSHYRLNGAPCATTAARTGARGTDS